MIFFSRPLNQGIYEVVKYVERDVTKYRCPNKVVYHDLVDLLVYLWWKQKNLEWVRGFSTVDSVPGTLCAPYEKEPTHVVLSWNEHDQHMHLLAGPTTEEKAHQELRNLRDEPGIVAFVEPLSEIILPTDGTDIVHAALGPKGHKGERYIKPDPEATDKDGEHFVVELPGCEGHRDYPSKLQFALERIATIEQTMFVTMICRILG